MLTIIVAFVAGVGSGAALGGALGFWISRSSYRKPALFDDLSIDPDLDRRIDRAADHWATANGRPEAASLVADKLRLAHRLSQRRQYRRWS